MIFTSSNISSYAVHICIFCSYNNSFIYMHLHTASTTVFGLPSLTAIDFVFSRDVLLFLFFWQRHGKYIKYYVPHFQERLIHPDSWQKSEEILLK